MPPTKSLLALLLTPLTLASSSTYQPLGTQSCRASDLGNEVNYTIHVGAYFHSGGKEACHAAVDALTAAFHGKPPTTKECSLGIGCCEDHRGGAGMTVLKGVGAMKGHGAIINEAMHKPFPAIGFDCPDCQGRDGAVGESRSELGLVVGLLQGWKDWRYVRQEKNDEIAEDVVYHLLHTRMSSDS
ncbi:hypothetical protein Tdes44962_MAKER09795 [Teratosphaeria destructans]|uniref:Killer toxin Kp4 domain-containing protein n=1 Tax=Teratosphaeria destructans TaxID=418781 RepID=A0A9W7SR64_9PEZI|nr:hypothetical protein Tdes44962_MAKER09795 [Teratosphaeria destructans]